MRRRSFIQAFLGLALYSSAGRAVSKPGAGRAPILIQESPVAGFQFHRGRAVWNLLAVGQSLRLVRELDNRFDARAVAVYWRDQQIGYVPRDANSAIAQMLDRGEKLSAVISQLRAARNPWRRVAFSVFV